MKILTFSDSDVFQFQRIMTFSDCDIFRIGKIMDFDVFRFCIDLDTLGDARKIHEKVDVSSEPIYASSVFMSVGLICSYSKLCMKPTFSALQKEVLTVFHPFP